MDGHKVVGGAICSLNPEGLISRAEYLLESIQLAPLSPARPVHLISTANCFIAREIFDRHGYFPDIKKGVDLVFSKQLILAGERIFFDPSIRIYHYYSETMSRFLNKQIYHGRFSYVARRRVSLPGSFIVNQPFLLPFFPLLRPIVVARHIIKLRTGLIRDYFSTFPIFLIGVIAWSYGFLRAALMHEQ